MPRSGGVPRSCRYAPARAAAAAVHSYNPGITLIPQTGSITHDTILAPCVFASPVTSGTDLDHVITATYSCLDLLSGPPGATTRVITWNTGQTSTVTYVAIVVRTGPETILTRTGTITAGLFAGDTMTWESVLQNPRIDQCQQPGGVTTVTGATTFTAVRPA